MNFRPLFRVMTLTTMFGLLLIYVFLNGNKLELVGLARDMLIEGPVPQTISIKMGKDQVYSGPLSSSDIHDFHGQKQINFVDLPGDLLTTAKASGKRLIISLGDESAPALPIGSKGLLNATFSDRIVRLYSAASADALMDSIYEERLKGRNIVECLDPRACATVKLQSEQWSRLTGPFLKTDISEDRRGLPKGRWLYGPETQVELHSETAQTIQMLVYVMSTVPKQEIRFDSSAVTRIEEFYLAETANLAGRLLLFPRVFMLELRLEQGVNPIDLVFSGALLPTEQRPAKLAAFITRVRIKTMDY